MTRLHGQQRGRPSLLASLVTVFFGLMLSLAGSVPAAWAQSSTTAPAEGTTTTAPADEPAGGSTTTAPAVDTSAVGDTTGNFSPVVWVLIPLALVVALLTALTLGGAGEPTSAARRGGGVSRALEARQANPSSSI